MNHAEVAQEPEQITVSATKTNPPLSEKEAAEVRLDIARMRPGNPVRQASEIVLETGVLPAEFVEPLLSRLRTFHPSRWRTQQQAMWLLCYAQVEGEARGAICACMREIVAHWPMRGTGNRMLRTAGGALALSGGFVMTLMCLKPVDHDYAPALLVVFVLGGIFWAAILPIMAMAEHHKMVRLRETALVVLGRLPTVENLAVVAEACLEGSALWRIMLYGNMRHDRSRTIRANAAWALLNILPCVRKSDYGRFPSSVVPNLCRILAYMEKAEDVGSKAVILRILRALNHIGDTRAIPSVEQMEKRSTSETVRQAATRTLHILRERQRQESATQTLLRASEAVAPTPDSLLRAADAVPKQTNADEMLRAERRPTDTA